MTKQAGVYLHWPFCAKKCPYCDFYTFGREHPDFDLATRYEDALVNEIKSANERFGLTDRPRIDTIYFGGGTPSLIEPKTLEALLNAVHSTFDAAPDTEITLEVNPTAAETERLAPARELGVNRLSVGCQSFNDRFLKLLGRDHDAGMARRTSELIREIGYDNISLDLMFGLPGQTLDDFANDLEEGLSFAPEHLSAYGLTLHEGTPYKRWHAEGRWTLPGEELEATMFEHLIDRMAAAGYEHYEISNWSRPGRASRHNSKYWSDTDLYAFGASAHGVRRRRRYANPRDLAAYVRDSNAAWQAGSDALPPPESERAARGEVMMLALRRVGGVRWEEIEAWMGANPRKYYADELSDLSRRGLIEANNDGIRLTRAGIMLADGVMEPFF